MAQVSGVNDQPPVENLQQPTVPSVLLGTIISKKTFARVIRVKMRTLDAWEAAGTIPVRSRNGRRVRYLEDAVAYLRSLGILPVQRL